MKKITLLSLVLILGLLLVACGGPKIEGKWESVYSKANDAYAYQVGFIELDFKADKTVIAIGPYTLTGTWEKKGDEYTIVFEDDPGSAKFEGELLAISTPDGAVYYFARDAKNFKNFPEGMKDMPKE